MLNRLLDTLRAGGTRRMADLARDLDTTPELVEAMLEDLCRMGYLKRFDGCAEERGSGGECRQCALAGLCAASDGGRIWTLIEKARTASDER
jgi:DNA-binding Lrp family transcriptional regulator